MKWILRFFLFLLSIIVVIMAVITIIFMVNKNENAVTYIGPYTFFITTGTSMSPTIDVNELLFVKKDNLYNIDDIITFKNDEGITTTHRIIESSNGKYITKGDNNNFTDGYSVTNSDIYGKVFFKVSHVNEILRYSLIAFVCIVIIYPTYKLIRWSKHVR